MTVYSLLAPLFRIVGPESAHSLSLFALKRGLVPRRVEISDPILKVDLWGLEFKNPIGLAAGFDKNCVVPNEMLRQGFGFVEIGSVTPKPQTGNPRPRVFRLGEDQAVINRLGFNSQGSAIVAKNLLKARRKKVGIIGVNIGKNKSSKNAIEDYTQLLSSYADRTDYLAINVSSPNTPGLRALQKRKHLEDLLKAIKQTLKQSKLVTFPPLLVKISPDLSEEDKHSLAEVILDNKVDGLIATNSTIVRPNSLTSNNKNEIGGLSGQPLFDISTRVVNDFFRLTEGKVPIIGVGGVASGMQAYRKIRAGASLVQLYSALIYRGPSLITKINRELADLLKNDGFENIADAVGVDVIL